MAGQVRILVVMANPPIRDAAKKSVANISVGLDYRTIQDKVNGSTYRDLIEITPSHEPNARQLQDDLLRVDPHVVHFACHGSPFGVVLRSLHNPLDPALLETEVLGDLLQTAKSLQLAVFNSCETEAVGEALTKKTWNGAPKKPSEKRSLDYVVTMRTPVSDVVATEFASGFYLALGCERSVRESVKAGVNAIGVRDRAEASIPKLQIRRGKTADASRPFTALIEATMEWARTGLIELTPPKGMWPKNGYDYQVLEVCEGGSDAKACDDQKPRPLLNNAVSFELERNPARLVARVLNAVDGLQYKCFVDLPDRAPAEDELVQAFADAGWGPPEKNEQIYANHNRRWFHLTEREQQCTTPEGYRNDFLPFDPPQRRQRSTKRQRS